MFNYLSGDEALYGVGEHDDTGEEEPSGIGNWVDLTVVIEEITCKEMKEPTFRVGSIVDVICMYYAIGQY